MSIEVYIALGFLSALISAAVLPYSPIAPRDSFDKIAASVLTTIVCLVAWPLLLPMLLVGVVLFYSDQHKRTKK